MASTAPKISFIGFGEAAQAFTQGLRDENSALTISAFDVKTDGPEKEAKRANYETLGIAGKSTIGEVCNSADLIFSLVTADQAEVAASQAAETKLDGTLYLDCNSCAPETKRRAAAKIESAGGRYIDVAVMTPVHPRLHKSPCFMAGADADAALETITALGMVSKIVGTTVGEASVRKMVRSVMIKGLEALTLECFLAARKAGIDEEVLASLDTSFPEFNWTKRAPYMIERAMTHGTRRAAEMVESAQTLRDLGITPYVTEATVERQRQIGALSLDAKEIGTDDLTALTDAVLANLPKNS